MQPVVPGSTDVSVTVRFIDAADGTPEEGVTSATSGLTLRYQVGDGALQTITPADLTNLNDSHADGGMKHKHVGDYRLCIPDAAVPASEGQVTTIHCGATDMIGMGTALVGRTTPSTYAGGDTSGVTTLLSRVTALLQTKAEADTAHGLLATAASIAALNDLDATEAQAAAAAALAAYDPPTHAELTSGLAAADDAVLAAIAALSIPTASQNADAVWDEATSGHTTPGTTGKALSDAGAAGDPWSASVRTLTQPAASVVAAVTGSNITLYTHATASISLTGLGSIAARDQLWFVVTSAPEDDDAAEVLIEETAGLTRLAGAAYATAAHGSITVDDAADGDITVTLAATAAAGLTRGTHGYAVKMRAGTTVTMLSHGGRCSIVQGAPEAIA